MRAAGIQGAACARASRQYAVRLDPDRSRRRAVSNFQFRRGSGRAWKFHAVDRRRAATPGRRGDSHDQGGGRRADLIAEDLGTVPPWVRQSLTHLGVPGYKVMQWERAWGQGDEPFISPASYPELSLATTGTHDTEPLTVWWHAQPLGDREKFVRALGLEGKVNPRRMLEESARDAILAVAVLGAVAAGDHSRSGFVWMECADQSAGHDQRFELDLSTAADAGTDAPQPRDTVARREAARNRDQERTVRGDADAGT